MECDIKVIEKDSNDFGIIFVTSNDSISRLVMTVTKYDFSSIGFYYNT